MTLSALLLLLGSSAHALHLSSATITDPHELAGPRLAPSASYRALTVYPERLAYGVSWGILPVGRATLLAEEVVEFAGRPAYHIVSTADSNRFCDTFYKVRDVNESWIDARRLTSLGYSKKLREGHYLRDEWVLYDDAEGRFLARWVDKEGHFTFRAGTVPVSVQDILSSLYYVRSKDLSPGAEVILDVNTKQNWPLVVRVLRREQVTTPAGKFSTVLVEPAIRQEGIFIQKGKRLLIWLTDDKRKIPVLMQVEVFFGHVTAALEKML